MRINYNWVLTLVLATNVGSIALIGKVSVLFPALSLGITIFLLLFGLVVFIDDKLSEQHLMSLSAKVDVLLLVVFLTLGVGLASISSLVATTYPYTFWPTSEMGMLFWSFILVAFVLLLFGRKFAHSVRLNHIKRHVLFVIHPHKLHPENEDDVEVSIVNKSKYSLLLTLRLFPENAVICGTRAFPQNTSPYRITVKKKERVTQHFRVTQPDAFQFELQSTEGKLFEQKVNFF